MTAETPAQIVFKKFGGLRPTARAIKRAYSTVQRWAESGFIPPRQQSNVLRTARELGIDLDASDLVPSEDDTARLG